jgi:hypothetical protein
MSRSYEMTIGVTEIPETDRGLIKERILQAIADLGYEEDDLGNGGSLFLTERLSLGGGCGEDEASEELAHAIWRAARCFVQVEVAWLLLDREPDYYHSYEQDAYEEFVHPLELLAQAADSPRMEE